MAGKGLKRSLTAWDLTLLGIGAIIGTGIFVLTGTAAANQAGPAIMMSYLAAGLACAFAALCYAEFASMIPVAGSAYTYAYATLGELVAWMIGWDLILEYAVGSMTVAIGWSGYMQRLLAGVGIELPAAIATAPPTGGINLLATLIVLVIMVLLVIGVRESARFNAAMVAIKLVAIVFFIGAGATFVKPENWSPFAPYGWSGIMAAAAVVFFAYIGFDAVSTTAEEAQVTRSATCRLASSPRWWSARRSISRSRRFCPASCRSFSSAPRRMRFPAWRRSRRKSRCGSSMRRWLTRSMRLTRTGPRAWSPLAPSPASRRYCS